MLYAMVHHLWMLLVQNCSALMLLECGAFINGFHPAREGTAFGAKQTYRPDTEELAGLLVHLQDPLPIQAPHKKYQAYRRAS